MIKDVGLPEMYRGKVNLWVEDAITRVYLKECWQNDPDVLFLTGGGNDNVGAVVKDAEERGYRNVVGFIDRDFRMSNRADWLNLEKGSRRFVPTVHELENYLLDEAALAACAMNTGRRSAADILQRLQVRAGQLVWWMACRRVIADLREEFLGDFPEHPKCPQVDDQASAERYIVDQDWFKQLKERANTVTTTGEISTRLGKAHVAARGQLSSNDWKRDFSGKELFRDVRGWIYINAPERASKSELDVDMARAVAQWQVANGTVPSEVTELRSAIRRKAGI